MKWTSLNDLREAYLSFFESKGHLRLPSFSLVPQGDKSLLLINAGMAPMKKYFTGEVTPPRTRVTTCQKCIRMLDVERVGKTARHGTYFEMLGNFSFGDYFKHEATAWAWEFCTKVLELPVERLWVSIYQEDDEAFDIWTKEVGVSPDHIVRLGKEDNFWEHGSGPCGPCSELYFDRGEEYGCGSPTCGVGCDCDRYVEFWNLVFTQFDSDGQGTYTPLDHPNIDTGMGLERLACIMQGVGNLFEVDTVRRIITRAGELAKITYGEDAKADVSLRVITDHIRSITFLLSDGVMPSNEGRGYVLRRLVRRAARHGRLLGIRDPFLYQLSRTVVEENKNAYPQLVEKQAFIEKLIRVEEDIFGKTIDSGLSLLEEKMAALEGTVLPGADAFKLYDTFGFPVDLTRDIAEEKGLTVDEAEFDRLMNEQRQRARAARKDAGADAWKGESGLLDALEATQFVGYHTLSQSAQIVALVRDEDGVDTLSVGDTAVVALNVTPFYAESGGQAGDVGVIRTETACFRVDNTKKTAGGVVLHFGEVIEGDLGVGNAVTAEVDRDRREATMRNHTAAHLLQAALRSVLGTHVEQAGQLVNAQRMRFDFTHFSALTAEELAQVEDRVNAWVLSALPVNVSEMSLDEAKKQGAMALFGEKYGDTVRVVRVGDTATAVSIELCGGTHVDNTARLGLFHIAAETSVAAGVRRIEAVTGAGVRALLKNYQALLNESAALLKAGTIEEVPQRIQQIGAELKETHRQIETMQAQAAAGQVDSLLKNTVEVNGMRLVTAVLTDATPDALRSMGDRCRDAGADIVAVLAGVQKDKGTVSFVCSCGKDAVAHGAHAGNLVREIAKRCGGNGGGRPDSAMAGGKDLSKVNDAMAEVEALVRGMLH